MFNLRFGAGLVPAQRISSNLCCFVNCRWRKQTFHGDGRAAQQQVCEVAHVFVGADVSDLTGAIARER